MNKQVCHKCGSRSFKADRALAGRVICSNCSTPLTKDLSVNKYIGVRHSHNFFFGKTFIILLIATFLLVIIVNL